MFFTVGTSEKVRILNNGNFGLGTSSPAKPLHISSADNQPLRVESTDAYSGIELKDNGSSTLPPLISALSDDFIFYGGHSTTRPAIMFLDSSSESVGIGTTNPAKDLVINNTTGAQLQLQFNANDRFRMEADSFGGSFYSPSGYGARFFTSGSERMRIDATGNIGIGTTSPDFELDVAGSIGIDDYIYHNGDHNTYIRAQGDQWTFRTGGDDRMHIDNTGVGIGTTSPQNKLHVKTGSSGASSFDSRYKIILENDGEAYFSSYVPDNSFSGTYSDRDWETEEPVFT